MSPFVPGVCEQPSHKGPKEKVAQKRRIRITADLPAMPVELSQKTLRKMVMGEGRKRGEQRKMCSTVKEIEK